MKQNPRDDLLAVQVKGHEDIDQAIRKFSKKFKSSDLMRELLDRRSYAKPSEKNKRKMIRARQEMKRISSGK